MKNVLYTVGFLVAVLWLSAAEPAPRTKNKRQIQGNANCHQYTPRELNVRHCTSTMRNNDQGDFQDLFTLMNNANGQEHEAEFLIYVTKWLYKYIYCASDVEAILSLFYGMHEAEFPLNNSTFWQTAYDYLHSPVAPLVGRRKRQLIRRASPAPDDALMLAQIRNISRDTNPSCIQWLITQFNGTTAMYFIQENPHFPNPYDHMPLSTTLATTLATKLPTTPGTTVAAARTTTPASNPTKCTTCSMLDCLISPHVTDCAASQEFCMTAVMDTDHGREITRGCTTRAYCEHNHNVAGCNEVEDRYLTQGTGCKFCCAGENCNRPPSLLPNLADRYPIL